MYSKQPLLGILSGICLVACADEVLNKSPVEATTNEEVEQPEEPESGDPPQEDLSMFPPEIVAGVGIGPAKLGDTYGELYEKIGPPDSSFEYYRIVFAVWLRHGIEIVFSVGEDGELSETSSIVSVGTKLMDGFAGEVMPGMRRSEVEALIGACADVVDDVHCYHPVGLYLGFGADDVIHTVAVHPTYTARSGPPEMAFSVGGEL